MSKSAGVPLELTERDFVRWRRRIVVTDAYAIWLGAVGRDGYGRSPCTVTGPNAP